MGLGGAIKSAAKNIYNQGELKKGVDAFRKWRAPKANNGIKTSPPKPTISAGSDIREGTSFSPKRKAGAGFMGASNAWDKQKSGALF